MNQQIFKHTDIELTNYESSIGSVFIGNEFCGSGFVVGNKQLVVTSAHNLNPINGPITYRTASDEKGENIKTYELEIINTLEDYDLVLLKSQEDVSEYPFTITPKFEPAINSLVYYYGFDKGKKTEQNMNRDATGSPIEKPQGRYIYNSYVMSIARRREGDKEVCYIEYPGYCVPGFSGGVIINENREVIAVNTRAWVMYTLKNEWHHTLNQAFSIHPLLEIINSLQIGN